MAQHSDLVDPLPLKTATVLLDTGSPQPLDYLIPPKDLSLALPGVRVQVPCRKKILTGTILAIKQGFTQTYAPSRLLPLAKILTDEPALTEDLLYMTHWIAEYYAVPLAKALKSLLPSPVRAKKVLQWGNAAEPQWSFVPSSPKTLNKEQRTAYSSIEQSLSKEQFAVHLLHGVTGSGKTEVYMHAIANVLQKNKSVIFMVPEISLTTQTLDRLRARFSCPYALVHHKLSTKTRCEMWKKIRSGQVPLILGARSAIFTPVPNLGLIIVDEEHDAAYKHGGDSPKYHARDLSIVRAKYNNAVCILGSATPSVESFQNAQKGKYSLHRLLKRATKAPLPDIEIVDMIREYQARGHGCLFSQNLLSKIKKNIEKGEKSLLFLNRRGYHTVAQCPHCAEPILCQNCSITLTHHKERQPNHSILLCHVCGFQQTTKSTCPSCNFQGDLIYKGVGTQKVERSLHAAIPEVTTLRLDADSAQDIEKQEKIIRDFRSGKADVLIGTQMLAKGLHFPQLTLVGIIDIDHALNIPDFRSGEFVFQLLTQVAGRAGRESLPGHVIIQTRMPNNPIIQMAARGDFESFFLQELSSRALFHFPPHQHLIKCTTISPNEHISLQTAKHLATLLVKHLPPSCVILPVSPAGHIKLRNKFYNHFLVKCPQSKQTSKKIYQTSQLLPKTKKVSLTIDVDPISTFFT